MARLSRTQRLDGRTIRQLFSRRSGETPRVSPTKSRRADGLPAHRGLDQFYRGPGGSGLKGRRTSVPKHHDQQKDPLLGQPREAADRAPDEECTRPKPLRVRKAVQNRHIDLSATDPDRRNRRRWHISGEASPRRRRHCSSILVSPRKNVGAVTAEYTGY